MVLRVLGYSVVAIVKIDHLMNAEFGEGGSQHFLTVPVSSVKSCVEGRCWALCCGWKLVPLCLVWGCGVGV